MIAHRMSTVINAMRICVLDGGTIAEMGAYVELMERRGISHAWPDGSSP